MKLFEVTIEYPGMEPITQVHELSDMVEALSSTAVAVEALGIFGVEPLSITIDEVEALPAVECEVILLVA